MRPLLGDSRNETSFGLQRPRGNCSAGAIPLHPDAVTAFRFIQPCSPIRTKEVPAGDGWVHEVKI